MAEVSHIVLGGNPCARRESQTTRLSRGTCVATASAVTNMRGGASHIVSRMRAKCRR